MLDAQQALWEHVFSHKQAMFGEEPSEPARLAAALFKQEGKSRILELGAGQGRDCLYFARCGLHVTALDYSQGAADALRAKAQAAGLASSLAVVRHDVREPLPLENESFDGCFSHMLYCMALTTGQLERLSREVWHVLGPGGLNIYTVRHKQDPWYGAGVQRGEDLYEVNGFILHFFDRRMVMRLAQGYTVVSIDEFEEGDLPRKLYRVTLRKEGGGTAPWR
jgi:SAM-dependent methyltransferase